MARDGRLPFGSHSQRCRDGPGCRSSRPCSSGSRRSILLALNLANQSAFLTLTSVAIIMFYLPYLAVTGAMLRRRLRGEWPRPEHGPYFNIGRCGLPVNIFAVIYGAIIAFEIAWPRAAVYGTTWYFRFGAYEFIGAVIHHRLHLLLLGPAPEDRAVLAEHRAEVPSLARRTARRGGAVR